VKAATANAREDVMRMLVMSMITLTFSAGIWPLLTLFVYVMAVRRPAYLRNS